MQDTKYRPFTCVHVQQACMRTGFMVISLCHGNSMVRSCMRWCWEWRTREASIVPRTVNQPQPSNSLALNLSVLPQGVSACLTTEGFCALRFVVADMQRRKATGGERQAVEWGARNAGRLRNDRDHEVEVEMLASGPHCLGFRVHIDPTPADGACFSHSLHQWFESLERREQERVLHGEALHATTNGAARRGAQSCWEPRHWAAKLSNFVLKHFGDFRSVFTGGYDDDVYMRGLRHFSQHPHAYNSKGVLVDPKNGASESWSAFDDLPWVAAAYHGINIVIVRTTTAGGSS